MQPYQRATDEILKGKKEAAQIGVGLVGLGLKGSAIARGFNAFLTRGVPSSIALKGMEKLNPYIQKFAKDAKGYGYEEDEIVDHIRDESEKQQSSEPKSQIAPQQKASEVLKSLGQDVRVKNLLERGAKPEDVAGIVNQVLKGDERKRFGDMLKSGSSKPLIDLVKEYQQEISVQSGPTPGSPPIEPQAGQGQQALMAILQKIQAQRGVGG